MVIEFKKPWTEKKFDDFLRKWYNSKVHVDPAMLSLGLRDIGWKHKGDIKKSIRIIINRLSELGLRKKR